jgi:hypothetical protein
VYSGTQVPALTHKRVQTVMESALVKFKVTHASVGQVCKQLLCLMGH